MKNLLINRALAAKKHKLFALFLALVAGIGTVLAQCTDVNSDIRINGIYYLFDSSTLTAAVASPCHENGYSGAVIIPSTVTYQGKTYDVTKILFTAFYYNNNLKSVTIPNSVVEVGGLAFSNCPNLTSVNFPNSITEINYTYPYVDNCPSLTSPIYNQHFFMYLPTSYSGAYTIPDGIEIINCSAFCGCTSLTSIEIPNSVTSIGWSAFKNCSSLTSIEIPNSVTSIGMSAFYGCTGLTSVTIPNSVTSIGRSAFYGCTGLTSVTIPNSVTSIGEYAFDNCSSLTSIYVPCGEIDRFKQMLSAYGDKVQYAPLPYNLTILSSELGQIKTSDICEEFLMTAVPNYGYHFTQWSDGITENPRMITFSKDTTFAAEYAKNTYSIETQANNQGWGTTAGDGAALYQEQLQISATPNYGYHFVQWNDGNTENPRSVVLTQDTTFTVTFAKNVYSITKVANSTQGSISGASQAEYLDNVELTAVPNYGYHFTKWLDGNIDNPRSFVITGDTTFTAEFAKNTYTITTSSTNSEWGTTSGGGAALYQEQLQISATPNYGYHFDHWNDGNTANPRTVTVTEDKTYQAIFAKNVYSVIKVANSTQGTISGASQAEYLDNVELTATSNYGYYFAQWSDGVMENPRSFVITRDTTFTAEFALDRTGTCGNNLALTWTYNPEKKVLTIEGNGAFVENIQCGVEARPILEKVIIGKGVTAMNSAAFTGCPNLTAVEWNATDGGDCTACPFPTSVTSVTLSNGVEHIPAYLCNGLTGITSIVIPSSVKSIGDYAFANINSRKINDIVLPSEIISIGDYAFAGNTYIEQIDFGKSLEFIGAYAFQGCSRVMTMTCLAEMTPDVGTDGLASISSNADLYVLSSALRKYQVDPNWSRFLLKELGAKEETTINQVIVVPGDNIAIFTWPTTDGAGSYTIQITKDGELVCTLIFNSNGQLTGIAFAPSRDGTATAPAATLSVAGMSFTVTGLNSASKYAYSLAVADDDNKELVSYHGEFATTGYEGEVTPGGEPERPGGGGTTSVDQLNVQSSMSNVKYIKDGQLFIRQGDKIFNAHGARVK